MTKRTIVLALIVAVVAAGGIFASNMGFKLNYQLLAPGAGSNSGTSTIALPYNAQSGIVNASDLQNDIGFAAVANVQLFDEATDGLTSFTGRKGGGPDFPLVAGDANFIKMISAVDYIVVGSHDPSLSVSLEAAGAGSNSGTNFFSYPYHSTSGLASELQNDIGFAAVANVQNFDPATDSLTSYTGRKGGGPDFSLNPGTGYFIKMISDVLYVPSHY